MNPEVIEPFDTGTKKIAVDLVQWGPGDLAIRIQGSTGNFTTFHVHDKQEGIMKGMFLAACFKNLPR